MSSGVKGGVLTLFRQCTTEQLKMVETYKANLILSQCKKLQRNVVVLNVYIQPDWLVEELRDFIDVECWRIQAAGRSQRR